MRELELGLHQRGLASLLDFLEHSFHGGTEVDAPLQACLDRLCAEEWTLVRGGCRAAWRGRDLDAVGREGRWEANIRCMPPEGLAQWMQLPPAHNTFAHKTVPFPLALLDHVRTRHTAMQPITPPPQADVLMVTDGQFSPPGEGVVDQLAEARRQHGLRAHCLVVGSRVTEAARKFATDTHLYHNGVLTSFPSASAEAAPRRADART